MKKTAVQWLYENILLTPLDIREINKCLEQAKAMEKEQICDAFFEGKNDGILMERYSDYKHIRPNEYYNETFKSE